MKGVNFKNSIFIYYSLYTTMNILKETFFYDFVEAVALSFYIQCYAVFKLFVNSI